MSLVLSQSSLWMLVCEYISRVSRVQHRDFLISIYCSSLKVVALLLFCCEALLTAVGLIHGVPGLDPRLEGLAND